MEFVSANTLNIKIDKQDKIKDDNQANKKRHDENLYIWWEPKKNRWVIQKFKGLNYVNRFFG